MAHEILHNVSFLKFLITAKQNTYAGGGHMTISSKNRIQRSGLSGRFVQISGYLPGGCKLHRRRSGLV